MQPSLLSLHLQLKNTSRQKWPATELFWLAATAAVSQPWRLTWPGDAHKADVYLTMGTQNAGERSCNSLKWSHYYSALTTLH